MADIEIEFAPPLARIRLNRPERRNAVNKAMWLRLVGVAAEIEARPDVRAVLVEGAGGNFCAGADIFEFDEVFAAPGAAKDYLGAIEKGLTALTLLDRPTIALLEGNSIGGGLAIGMCCDLRFCADDAHLAVPPAKLGLLYGPVETRRLVELIGLSRAKDLLFSGRRVEASEALAIGLVDRRLAPATLRVEAESYANDLARLSQTSIRDAKKMAAAVVRGGDDEYLRARIEEAVAGPDFKEGRTAFTEKRRPRFA